MRAADSANRVCRAVLLVIRMENKKNIESVFERGIGRYFVSVVRKSMFRKFPG